VNDYGDRFKISRLLIDMIAILRIKMRIVVGAVISLVLFATCFGHTTIFR
jgi:hypothetical protein